MKLCHIVPSLQEEHGGPSKSVRALARALAAAGHDVELLATDPKVPAIGMESESAPHLRTRIFRRDAPARLCPSEGLETALAATPADVVHHHALWLRTLHYAQVAATERKLPFVLSPRGMMSPWAWTHHRGRKLVANWFVHPGALNAVTGWHATSTQEAEDIKALGFTQPVCIAPNGVDAPTPTTVATATAYWRDCCPEVTRRPVALFYGRLHRKKRVRELIDTWLEQAPTDWLLLIVGIPEEYQPETLQQHAANAGGGDRVRVFSGTGRPPPYAVAQLFLLPSHNENFGLVIAEAMANGVPVIVTDATPWQAVNEAARGWCVPWRDYPAALRAATREPIARLRERGQRAQAWVLAEYSWQRTATQLGAFYERLRATMPGAV